MLKYSRILWSDTIVFMVMYIFGMLQKVVKQKKSHLVHTFFVLLADTIFLYLKKVYKK